MTKKRFGFNDETKKNSYGFYVKTEGISLDRFLSNPICLRDHKNDTKNVLGQWGQVKTEGKLLSGIPIFDTEDTEAKEVVRKVQKGILKACSMGISFVPKDMKMIDGKLTLTACELLEVSIVAVPSNANAIVLYNQDGELLSEDKVKSLCLSVQSQSKQPTKYKGMKRINAYLQLDENADEAAVIVAVKEMEAKLSAATTERDNYKQQVADLEAAETARLKADFETEAAEAVKDGRLNADGEAALLELADGKYDKATVLLKALPKQKSISDELKGEEKKLAAYAKMSWDELDKGNHLAKLKAEHKEYYEERFEQEFGKKPE